MLTLTIPTAVVHGRGLVCITDARFLSPAYLARLADAERQATTAR